ncbi:glycopeptide antibiotics resistance protein [Diaminobutyricimonas aerilata]|uniref:Glycopeptide antibiotics resistance protein n=1 Tax=Diaminobutyricimonas aerilata TaxID=1162967 RepID=A0A2M9CLZ2_9MICO|nr:VanZ family protein [Diaminobutyricimonas aerilata]PJJ72921.1 glycopeptide antibiotics resistance protein [Diaminobutyricimonas aerilata]
MGEWTWQAGFGVFGGLLLFGALLVPAVMVQYRRYGRISARRMLGAVALSIYGVALVAYTLLPLPSPEQACAADQSRLVNLIPFHFIDDIARENPGASPLGLATSRASLQVVLNVALFVPLGVFVRRYFHRGTLTTTIVGFAGSVLIELTQYTGLFGLYACSYRVADVDDVLANTLGAVLGGLVAPAVLWWMPRRRDLEATRLEPRPVSGWRRWLGMLLDVLIFGFISSVVSVAATLLRTLIAGTSEVAPHPIEHVVAHLVPGLLVFFVPALFGYGASLGQRIVFLAPVWDGAPGSTGQRLARASVTGGAYTLGLALGDFGGYAPFALLSVLTSLVVLVSFTSVPFTRGHRGLSGALTGADMADARALPHVPTATAALTPPG